MASVDRNSQEEKIYLIVSMGEAAAWKKVTQIVAKRLPQIMYYCSAVMEGGREFLCALAWTESGELQQIVSPLALFSLIIKHFSSMVKFTTGRQFNRPTGSNKEKVLPKSVRNLSIIAVVVTHIF